MKKICCLLAVFAMLVGVISGCKKMPAVDKNVKPAEHLSQYQRLTELYGTPWRDVLAKLDVDLQELNTEGLNHVGVPIQETYAGITFDTFLRFDGEENALRGVTLSATYRYPEDEAAFLKDVTKVCRELITDLGDPSDTSMVFNFVDKVMGETWNRDIAFWQDTQILKRLADQDYSSTLVLWNLRSVASESVLKVNNGHSLSVSFSIREEEGTAVLDITY